MWHSLCISSIMEHITGGRWFGFGYEMYIYVMYTNANRYDLNEKIWHHFWFDRNWIKRMVSQKCTETTSLLKLEFIRLNDLFSPMSSKEIYEKSYTVILTLYELSGWPIIWHHYSHNSEAFFKCFVFRMKLMNNHYQVDRVFLNHIFRDSIKLPRIFKSYTEADNLLNIKWWHSKSASFNGYKRYTVAGLPFGYTVVAYQKCILGFLKR